MNAAFCQSAETLYGDGGQRVGFLTFPTLSSSR